MPVIITGTPHGSRSGSITLNGTSTQFAETNLNPSTDNVAAATFQFDPIAETRRYDAVSNKADIYREHARDCLEQAANARDPEVRQQLKDVASHWLQLAEQIEKYRLN